MMNDRIWGCAILFCGVLLLFAGAWNESEPLAKQEDSPAAKERYDFTVSMSTTEYSFTALGVDNTTFVVFPTEPWAAASR